MMTSPDVSGWAWMAPRLQLENATVDSANGGTQGGGRQWSPQSDGLWALAPGTSM